MQFNNIFKVDLLSVDILGQLFHFELLEWKHDLSIFLKTLGFVLVHAKNGLFHLS